MSAGSPAFVTALVEEGTTAQSIQQIVALDTYLVKFKDAQGKDGVRIIFKVPGTDTIFTMKDVVNRERLVANAHPWFRDQFNEMLENRGAANSPRQPGEDGAGSI